MGGRAVGPATRAPGRARGVSGGHAHRVSSGEASSLPPLRPPLPPLPLSRSLRFLQSPRPPPRPPARQSAATVRRLRRPPPPPPRAVPLHCGATREFWQVIRRSLSTVSRRNLERVEIPYFFYRRGLERVLASNFPVTRQSCTRTEQKARRATTKAVTQHVVAIASTSGTPQPARLLGRRFRDPTSRRPVPPRGRKRRILCRCGRARG